LSKLAIKLIDNIIDLLDINKICIVKIKEYFAKAKNRKSTIIQVEKRKIKFLKRNFLDFKYIDATIKVLRNSKCAVERDSNRDKAK
jgi:hypothetical protein